MSSCVSQPFYNVRLVILILHVKRAEDLPYLFKKIVFPLQSPHQGPPSPLSLSKAARYLYHTYLLMQVCLLSQHVWKYLCETTPLPIHIFPHLSFQLWETTS